MRQRHLGKNGDILLIRLFTCLIKMFRAPEILFRPELIGQDYYGMQDSIFKSVLQSDIDLRRDLVGNIVLSGMGTTRCQIFL